jgi:hypothetical protein
MSSVTGFIQKGILRFSDGIVVDDFLHKADKITKALELKFSSELRNYHTAKCKISGTL